MLIRLVKKLNPIKKLSDAEHEAMLQNRLIKVEAELAIIDEDIAALRKSNSK